MANAPVFGPGRFVIRAAKARRKINDVAQHPVLIHSRQPQSITSDVQPLTADLRRDFTDSLPLAWPQMVR
jgi:hypothetical protein